MNNSKNIRKKEGFVGQKMIVIPPNVRKTIGLNSLSNNLYPTAIGYYPLASNHDRVRKKGIGEYIFLYCIEGEGEVKIENKNFKVYPNNFVVIPPYTVHHYRSSLQKPWSLYWAHFQGTNASLLYSRIYPEGTIDVRPLAHKEENLKIFRQVIQILGNNFDEKLLELASIQMLYFFSSIAYKKETDQLDIKHDRVNNSIEFMKKNLDKSLSNQELASQQNLSVSHYSSLFKAETGYSPSKYLTKLKIQKSCQYLYFTDMTIKEICLKLGFDDPYYFSRLFKKQMRVAPSNYKGLIELDS
ncbi:MAG: AraC family transcriptional regulator [Marinoscillum sp.]